MTVDQLSNRQKLVLAALATVPDHEFAPVQVQKLFFLLDQNVADRIGGRLFNFQPYDYGPFDAAVYRELETLQRLGHVNVTNLGSRRLYSLTAMGHTDGQNLLKLMSADLSTYITRVAQWVRSLSFAQLVGSIYQQYPEMRANSIFQG